MLGNIYIFHFKFVYDVEIIRTYNSEGLLESVDHTDDKTSYLDNYLYDKNQNLIQVNRIITDYSFRTDLPTVLYTYEYIYDDTQNWIKQIFTPLNPRDASFNSNTPFTIVRKIMYY